MGDEAFQTKYEGRLDGLIVGDSAVVLVTHNLLQVGRKASRAMWLDHGRARLEGDPHEVVEAYRGMSAPGDATPPHIAARVPGDADHGV